MKSLEKLRKVAEEQSSPVACKLVRVYTDMDGMSAGNSEIKEALGNALDEIEQELLENYIEISKVNEEYIQLPRDMNGRRVNFGDILHDPDDGHAFRVDGFDIWGGTNEWWAYQQDDYSSHCKLEKCSLDSWESIEEDARKWMSENGTPYGVMNFIGRCKALAGVK